MDDCSVKFLIIRSLELFGVGFYSVQTDEKKVALSFDAACADCSLRKL